MTVVHQGDCCVVTLTVSRHAKVVHISDLQIHRPEDRIVARFCSVLLLSWYQLRLHEKNYHKIVDIVVKANRHKRYILRPPLVAARIQPSLLVLSPLKLLLFPGAAPTLKSISIHTRYSQTLYSPSGIQPTLLTPLRSVQELVYTEHIRPGPRRCVLLEHNRALPCLLLLRTLEGTDSQIKPVLLECLPDTLLGSTTKGRVVPSGNVASGLVDRSGSGGTMEEGLVVEVVGVFVGKGIGEGLLVKEPGVKHRLFAKCGFGKTKCNFFRDVTMFLSVGYKQ